MKILTMRTSNGWVASVRDGTGAGTKKRGDTRYDAAYAVLLAQGIFDLGAKTGNGMIITVKSHSLEFQVNYMNPSAYEAVFNGERIYQAPTPHSTTIHGLEKLGVIEFEYLNSVSHIIHFQGGEERIQS